jgi:hypothetical protein
MCHSGPPAGGPESSFYFFWILNQVQDDTAQGVCGFNYSLHVTDYWLLVTSLQFLKKIFHCRIVCDVMVG